MLVASTYVLCFCLSQIRGDLVRVGTGVELRLSKFGLVQEWGWRCEWHDPGLAKLTDGRSASRAFGDFFGERLNPSFREVHLRC